MYSCNSSEPAGNAPKDRGVFAAFLAVLPALEVLVDLI